MAQRHEREGGGFVDYAGIWRPVITAGDEGLELSSGQLRALELRTACLRVAGSISQLLEDPTIKNDPVREASAVSSYWEGMTKIRDSGIVKNIHVGDDEASFNDPQKLAEYVAGQLLTIDGKYIPSLNQVLPQFQEHAQTEVKSENSDSGQARSAFVISTKNLSPKVKDWIILREMVNLTEHFLASELDHPSEDIGEPFSDEETAELIDAIEDITGTEDGLVEEGDLIDVEKYDALGGEHISTSARNMIEIAKRTGKAVLTNFNGIRLTVHEGDNPEEVVNYYMQELDRQYQRKHRKTEDN